MRSTFRLLASIKPGRYLEAGNPTGLTGLFTHPAPRSTLIYLYNSTLDKLKACPESSVYRQSVEALTRHRLQIVESIKPEGYDQWVEKAKQQIADHPEAFNTPPGGSAESDSRSVKITVNGRTFVTLQQPEDQDDRVAEWDGEEARAEDPLDMSVMGQGMASSRPESVNKPVEWVPEPQLEASQISDLETHLGAGLIEEVIQVAEGELTLIDTMLEAKVWEPLQEKPPPGQWDYFARDQHTPGTQEPPAAGK